MNAPGSIDRSTITEDYAKSMEVQQRPRLHRDWIDPIAYEIVETLSRAGFKTYLVGGCVRDLLVGIHPKDYDIATMAYPEDVRRHIRRAYIIGKRFRLVLVRRGDQQFEVATFRRDFDPAEFPDGPPPGDNIFGTPEEDARRRDFTVNSLFYDPMTDELIDYTGGIIDIKGRLIRMIGEPNNRLIEDPIRILRALRLAHKLKFSLDPELREAMLKQAEKLKISVLPRRREEYLKILRLKDPDITLFEAYDLGLLDQILPSLVEIYRDPERSENFNAYLHRLASLSIDHNNPIHLFGILVLAYVRTVIEPDPHKQLQAEQLMEMPKLASFMKEELGMFKLEQAIVTKALQVQPVLLETESFQRKGLRRQASLLRNESMPLALLMAEMDFTIDAAQLHFWRKELARFEERNPPASEHRHHPPARRRRRN